VIRQGEEVGYLTITGSGTGASQVPQVQFKEALLELRSRRRSPTTAACS
jgi:type IV pilus assembly protein PilQ